MANDTIVCPNCQTAIPLTDALSRQIREQFQKQFDQQLRTKEEEWTRKADSLAAKEKELELGRKTLQAEVDKRLKAEREKVRDEVKKELSESTSLQLTDLQRQISEKQQKLRENEQRELALLKKQRELEDRQAAMQLEVERRLMAERELIVGQVQKRVSEENRLKLLEKDKQLAEMHKQIEDLKLKSEQGSQQRQGEVLELDLEAMLRATFPMDAIEPVGKGISGADLVQRVRNTLGQECGTIIWEAKRAKAWSDDWIQKLKDDQRSIRAEVALIVTQVLPKGISNFRQLDGVWVTEIACSMGLAAALRGSLIQIANATAITAGREEKMQIVYQYLASTEFRQKVEAIMDTFVTMKSDLDAEKRSLTKIWAKREKQIERVISNTGAMYGDLQALMGSNLPGIKSLELETLTQGEETQEPDTCESA